MTRMMDWGAQPLAERLPQFCKFAVGYFDDVQVSNVEVFGRRPKQHAGRVRSQNLSALPRADKLERN